MIVTGVGPDALDGSPPTAPSSLSDTTGLGSLRVLLVRVSVREALTVSSLSASARVGARPRGDLRLCRSKGLNSNYRFQRKVS